VPTCRWNSAPGRAQLADPHQVLEGSGKLRRHIKLHSLDEVGRKQVAAYLQAAWQQQAP